MGLTLSSSSRELAHVPSVRNDPSSTLPSWEQRRRGERIYCNFLVIELVEPRLREQRKGLGSPLESERLELN